MLIYLFKYKQVYIFHEFFYLKDRKIIIIFIIIIVNQIIEILSIRFFSFTVCFLFFSQSRFKNSYWSDLKQLENTDLNEFAKKLPTIAKSSKSAN